MSEYQLEKAKTLVQINTESLTNIAKKCGFNSRGTFIRWFKGKTGLPPSKWPPWPCHRP